MKWTEQRMKQYEWTNAALWDDDFPERGVFCYVAEFVIPEIITSGKFKKDILDFADKRTVSLA